MKPQNQTLQEEFLFKRCLLKSNWSPDECVHETGEGFMCNSVHLTFNSRGGSVWKGHAGVPMRPHLPVGSARPGIYSPFRESQLQKHAAFSSKKTKMANILVQGRMTQPSTRDRADTQRFS